MRYALIYRGNEYPLSGEAEATRLRNWIANARQTPDLGHTWWPDDDEGERVLLRSAEVIEQPE